MTAAVAVVAILVAITIPAVKSVMKSASNEGSVRSLIGAALSTAQAIAAKEHRYAGVRFQKGYDKNQPDNREKWSQYMIFIVHDNDNLSAQGFRSVEGYEPIKLPEGFQVLDCDPNNFSSITTVTGDDGLNDKSTFSIVFSPSGKLAVKEVRTRNRDGVVDPPDTNASSDDIFNSDNNIENESVGRFYQDDYGSDGFAQEDSVKSFKIYEMERFLQLWKVPNDLEDYLTDEISAVYINPFTGGIINQKQN